MGWGSGTANFAYLVTVSLPFALHLDIQLIGTALDSHLMPFSAKHANSGRVFHGS